MRLALLLLLVFSSPILYGQTKCRLRQVVMSNPYFAKRILPTDTFEKIVYEIAYKDGALHTISQKEYKASGKLASSKSWEIVRDANSVGVHQMINGTRNESPILTFRYNEQGLLARIVPHRYNLPDVRIEYDQEKYIQSLVMGVGDAQTTHYRSETEEVSSFAYGKKGTLKQVYALDDKKNPFAENFELFFVIKCLGAGLQYYLSKHNALHTYLLIPNGSAQKSSYLYTYNEHGYPLTVQDTALDFPYSCQFEYNCE